VETTRGSGQPHVRPELLSSLDDPEPAPPPRLPREELRATVAAAFSAARAIAEKELKLEIEGASERIHTDKASAFARLDLAYERPSEEEKPLFLLEKERVEEFAARCQGALRSVRLELDQAAGLLPG
jgi:hypothetical protein